LNNIKGVSQVTPEFRKRLAAMEEDLTGSSHAKSKRVQVADCLLGIYQRLSPKLHFNATDFQYYVKAGQCPGDKLHPATLLVPYFDRDAAPANPASLVWGQHPTVISQ
jgi:hypothetical protein